MCAFCGLRGLTKVTEGCLRSKPRTGSFLCTSQAAFGSGCTFCRQSAEPYAGLHKSASIKILFTAVLPYFIVFHQNS